MIKISVCEDIEKAEELWNRYWPKECIFDLWPVRECFQKHFDRSPYFLIARQAGSLQGMIALSWIDEMQCFGHFPGEIWQGETWIEQNKIIFKDSEELDALLNRIPGPAKIRYLTQSSYLSKESGTDIDEIGYLFYPRQYGYSFQDYLNNFSGKSRKKIRKELDRLETAGLTYRYDRFEDIELLFRMNQDNYKERSYFSDFRFLRSFESLSAWLHANGMLRVTTVLVGGKVAAVDMGAIWNSTYTILAGATSPDFPGVAKLINFHHIERSCRERLAEVDFLCGDFNWKNRFHLTRRPLYRVELSGIPNRIYDGISRERINLAV